RLHPRSEDLTRVSVRRPDRLVLELRLACVDLGARAPLRVETLRFLERRTRTRLTFVRLAPSCVERVLRVVAEIDEQRLREREKVRRERERRTAGHTLHE